MKLGYIQLSAVLAVGMLLWGCGNTEQQQPPQVADRKHQHAEHAVSAVDQGQALLLGKREGGDARGGKRDQRRPERSCRSHQ